MRQKYLDHIESILERKRNNELLTYDEWRNAEGLFQYCSRKGSTWGGCLTMVKGGTYQADFDLTDEIRDNDKIPSTFGSLCLIIEKRPEEEVRNVLMEFAKYQDRIDDLAGV